jgi:hypothetical protein
MSDYTHLRTMSERLRAVVAAREDLNEQERAILIEAANRFAQIESHPQEFGIEIAVSVSTGEPRLNLIWRGVPSQIDVASARAMAAALLDHAEQAATEAAWLRFVIHGLGAPIEEAMQLQLGFRQFREAEARAEAEREPDAADQPIVTEH